MDSWQVEFLNKLLYVGGMLWRNSCGRPLNAPAAFINPCQPTVAKEPPSGPGWAHELKHDGIGFRSMSAKVGCVYSQRTVPTGQSGII